MQIHTTARHFSLDPDTRNFAHERLERLARFLRERERNGVEINLIVTAEKHGHTAEVTLRVLRRELVGREDAAEARVAIDLAVSRLERRLRRLKDQVAGRRKGGRARAAAGPAPAPPESTDGEGDFEAWLDDESTDRE